LNRNKKALPLIENAIVSGIASEGKAIIRHNDLVIFVPYVVPGDIIDVQLIRKRKKFAEGKAVFFHNYSLQRQKAFCEHYGLCGGCQWQILPYPEQLRYKQQQVIDCLTRIGKIDLPEISAIAGSAKTEFYRNKLEFTFSNKRWITVAEIHSGKTIENRNALGFHIPGMFDKVLDINNCWLQDPVSDRIRNEIKSFALKNGISFFDLQNRGGSLRTLIIRTSTTGEIMLIAVFFEDDPICRDKLLNHLSGKFPEITSLMYVINRKANDTITDLDVLLFKGNEFIYEEMEGLKFKISPKSFYQTNSEQALILYRFVRDFAGLTGKERVYDLYTGTGTIASFIAKDALQVIGIEYVPEAVEDARVNSALNGITNTLFFAGDMKELLIESFFEKYGLPEVIITDPPRMGMHIHVINAILFAAPQRIVYVSCNPATQARDLNALDSLYRVVRIQPVDMFPHTQHVENIVLLEKK
jgi:23S rRNA (uracil1939-C5)-methyltransferase